MAVEGLTVKGERECVVIFESLTPDQGWADVDTVESQRTAMERHEAALGSAAMEPTKTESERKLLAIMRGARPTPRAEAEAIGSNPFPALAPDEYAALRASIERFGVLVPIVVDSDGNVLDGHHRLAIANELKVYHPLTIVRHIPDKVTEADNAAWRHDQAKVLNRFRLARKVETTTINVNHDADLAEVARTLNLDRRHLTVEQRRSFTAELRAEGKSTRAIAKATGVSQSQADRDVKQVTHAGHLTPDVFAKGDRVSYMSDTKKPEKRTATVVEQYSGGRVRVQPDNKHMTRFNPKATELTHIEETPAPVPPTKVTGTDGKSYPAKRKPSKATVTVLRDAALKACIAYIEACNANGDDGWDEFLALGRELSHTPDSTGVGYGIIRDRSTGKPLSLSFGPRDP